MSVSVSLSSLLLHIYRDRSSLWHHQHTSFIHIVVAEKVRMNTGTFLIHWSQKEISPEDWPKNIRLFFKTSLTEIHDRSFDPQKYRACKFLPQKIRRIPRHVYCEYPLPPVFWLVSYGKLKAFLLLQEFSGSAGSVSCNFSTWFTWTGIQNSSNTVTLFTREYFHLLEFFFTCDDDSSLQIISSALSCSFVSEHTGSFDAARIGLVLPVLCVGLRRISNHGTC